MLDLDHEFDQSFDTNSAPEPTSKAAQPAFSPSDKAGQPAANPSAKAGPPGSKPAAWPLPPASSPTASSPPVAPIPPITAASINAINSALNNAPKGPVTHQDLGKDARSLAESAYQRIADEILESTREVCQRLISDGEKALERAKFLEGETAQKHEEAQKELEAAKALRAEAEAFREKSLAAVSEAQKQAQEILDRARTETDAQLSQVKQQASAEAEKLADEAQAMRAAAQQELEAQKLYTEAARLKAESNEALSQLRQQMGSLLSSPGRGAPQDRPAPAQPQSTNGRSAPHPASPPVPAPVTAPAPAQWDADLDESGVPVAPPHLGSASQAAPPTAPKAAPQGQAPAKPEEEDPTLSRKKAGRWFGRVG